MPSQPLRQREKERGQERTVPKHVSCKKNKNKPRPERWTNNWQLCFIATQLWVFCAPVCETAESFWWLQSTLSHIETPSPQLPPSPTSPAPRQKQLGTKTSLRQTNKLNCVKAKEQSAIPSTWWTWSPVHRAPCVAPSGHQSCWSQPPGVGSWLAPPQTGRWGTAHPCTTRAGRPVGSAPSEEATEQ